MTPGTDVRAWRLPWHFARSWLGSRRQRELLDGVERHCLFLGFPKSGHSLVGSLLDAHPEVAIAHELGALKYLHAGFSRRQIDWLVLENSRRQAEGGRREGRNTYVVPGQWQGRHRRLRVVGDKHGEGMTLRLKARPWLLGKARAKLAGLRLVMVIRNPFDIISSLTVPRRRRLVLETAAEYFFDLCETVFPIAAGLSEDILCTVRHEDVVTSPAASLERLCAFVGVEPSGEYIDACRSILFERPRRTRGTVEWPVSLVERVSRRIAAYPALAGYALDGD